MKLVKVTALLMVLALFGVGCSSKSENDQAAETPITEEGIDSVPVPVDPPPGTGGGSSTATNVVDFTPVSWAEMNSYVATHPLNNPSNPKLKVNLKDDGTGRFYGDVRIAYQDNGQQYEGVFTSGTGTNSNLDYSKSNGLKEYVYNVWFNSGNQRQFSGYFQDAYGAIVLVIEGTDTVNQGDGQGGTTVLNGSVWYRNFPYSQVPQGPYRKCWFITAGPYQCYSQAVIYKNSIQIDRYTKLGTFTGLSRSKAFQ